MTTEEWNEQQSRYLAETRRLTSRTNDAPWRDAADDDGLSAPARLMLGEANCRVVRQWMEEDKQQ